MCLKKVNRIVVTRKINSDVLIEGSGQLKAGVIRLDWE
jgi:hypothetical protein